LTPDHVESAILKLYYHELIDQSSALVRDTFDQYLDIVQILKNQCVNPEIESFYHGKFQDKCLDDGFGVCSPKQADQFVRMITIAKYSDIFIPYSVEGKQGVICESYHDYFQGLGEIGIRKGTSVEEEAENFIRVLLSEEVQDVNSKDGVSVNPKVLEKKNWISLSRS